MTSETVLVTGANGFLAKHCIRALLVRGFAVRGTVRRPEQAKAAAAVVTDDADGARRLSFVTADLLSDEGWPAAVDGCRYVLHVASVFPLIAPRDRDALIPVARDGTLRVLRAARAAGVERAVITSSCAAVWGGHRPDASRVFDESDWTLIDSPSTNSYTRSKTVAEKAAWEFIGAQPAGMDLVSVNPSFIMGPPLDASASASTDLLLMFLRGKYPFVPDYGQEYVDVRDVAEVHLAALEARDVGGRRFIVSGGPMTLMEIGRALGRALPDYRRKMPRGVMPDLVTRLLGLFDPAVRAIIPDLGPVKRVTTEAVRRTLGLTFRSADEAVVAMARRMIELGMV